MLSKIIDYEPRRAFCVRVVQDLFLENPQKQIMILAQYKDLLFYLCEKINEWGATVEGAGATAGLYVGGMKPAALAESEKKNVVCASYAYASEGLDIPSLSTLVMVSPKTDIEQSVGRILRTKHNSPIVVDILDSHDVFKNQWYKRRQFYKKCNYDIVYAKSDKYCGTDTKWKVMATRAEATAMADSDDEGADADAAPAGKCLL